MSSIENDGERNPYIFPKLVFGTSLLGNLYEDVGYETKKTIVVAVINDAKRRSDMTSEEIQCCFDCAGKYGGFECL